jgi:chaperonin GroEL
MPSKIILYQGSAREALKKGMGILVETVSITLGPKGRNVVLGKKFGTPQIVNDGVTIAKEINLTGNLENTGVCLIRQAASKTNEVAGDGTTTATVLAYAIIKQGMRNVTAGSNPIILKCGIEKAIQFVVNKIINYARPIKNLSDIRKVATISAGNDPEVGSLIASAIDKVGKEGFISLEEGKSNINELTVTKGMGFDRGFISGYFVVKQERMETILENPYILVTDKKITLVKQDLLPTLELVSKTNQPLLIIADDVQKEALATLIVNKMRGILNVVAVRAPGFGDRRKALLSDLAILTGGKVISSDGGYSLQNVEIELLGRARRVIIGKDYTTIISDINKQEVLARCEQLRRQIETSESTYEKEKIQERLEKLSGGVAVIKVGAATETEMKDRKLRLEDAINATKAAIEEGIIPGGGVALIRAGEKLQNLNGDNDDENTGIQIIAIAIQEPLRQIVANSGGEGAVVISKILNKKGNFVFDQLYLLLTYVHMYQFLHYNQNHLFYLIF